MSTLDPPNSRWLVVFNDEPYAMRIVAVEPANGDAFDEQRSDPYVSCLSAYEVEAASSEEARRTARQLHDVDRIRSVRARRRACRAQRRPAPHGRQVFAVAGQSLARAAQDLDLPRRSVRYADAIATAALRAGFQHRASRQSELTFEQYADQIPATAAATLYRYAALAVAGRTQEAVATLVNALATATSDL
ncbi:MULTISPECIES: hypothetical protein [unclassified Streptomyces]|uniref:hypothetical protein n=1 Tax=unclassified Streptomyces TaxID=2593676 RepID=UPI002E81152D|nr:hypothetical protein [Streptomyces sp. NBC_00589]WTI37410.1 hypothetical protein OIC96_21540 [Streptomyces sp. NBC_00775]WUB28913.1 hypothetical protein OHA51_28195 [Streptomyces sp. NBC_00589]